MTYSWSTTLYVSDEVLLISDMHMLQALHKRRQACPKGAVATGYGVFVHICRHCHGILVFANVSEMPLDGIAKPIC